MVQGRLDFEKIRAAGVAVEFAILKLWEGNRTIAQGALDPMFEPNAKAALAAGIEPFAYCFGYPLPDDGVNANRGPEEQAALFVAAVSRYPELAKRPLFIDLEWPPPNEWRRWGCTAAQVNDWCRRCCAEVERLMGVTPIIYTYPWWWRTIIQDLGVEAVAWAKAYPLWIASYNTAGKWPLPSQQPISLEPWGPGGWLFWQFDGDGGMHLPNGRDSDFCLFNGSLEELRKLAGWSPTRPLVAA